MLWYIFRLEHDRGSHGPRRRKRELTGEAVKHDRRHGPQVAREPVESVKRLWCHVGWRPGHVHRSVQRSLLHESGETEVEELHSLVGTDEDVVRLDVAVDHVVIVCMDEGLQAGDRDPTHLPGPQPRRGLEFRFQRLSGQKLHDDPEVRVFLQQVVDLYDVGVCAKCANQLCLSDQLHIPPRLQKLDCHFATELCVVKLVNFTKRTLS
mmetsp:Transcript_27459/g.59614  ORF Transcript_27459/g.59614 Transcript_27459/m.59614 type:complete len:208 (+) Transcript_27459:170-793(+)